MMFGAPDTAPPISARIPSMIILGADALLAARPATPIQLAHACLRVGYQHVVPASWGDELIALATLRELRNHSHSPAIQCSCPFVANRLLAVGTDLRPFLISLVAPPVILARYLRTAAGGRKLRITYVGRCPGAADESIDARLTPEELLATFADHHVDLAAQPEAFDSVIPPDRRRYRSQPGGLPATEMLWLADTNVGGARTLVELHGDELSVALAQQLLAGKPSLIDVAPRLGCVCSGATPDGDPTQARSRVAALEPPRAAGPVVDESTPVDARLALPASPRNAIDVVAPAANASSLPAYETAPNDAPSPAVAQDEAAGIGARSDAPGAGQALSAGMSRRYSPAHGVARLMSSGLPTARDADGRQLPRTYVARRRAPVRAAPRPPLDSEAPIPTSRESASARDTAPREVPNAGHVDVADSRQLTTPAQPVASPEQNGTRSAAESSTSSEAASPHTTAAPPLAAPAQAAPVEHKAEIGNRYAERPAPAPRHSAARRDALADQSTAERPVMQLLTLGLLIAMIVLVSAAIGLVVGRWMTQR